MAVEDPSGRWARQSKSTRSRPCHRSNTGDDDSTQKKGKKRKQNKNTKYNKQKVAVLKPDCSAHIKYIKRKKMI